MKPSPSHFNLLSGRVARQTARLAALATLDTLSGGASALVLAKNCDRFNVQFSDGVSGKEIVRHVYGNSSGRTCQRFGANPCVKIRAEYNKLLAKLDREARADRCKGDIVTGWDWPTLAIVKPLEYNRLRELNEEHKKEFRSLRAAGLLPLKNN